MYLKIRTTSDIFYININNIIALQDMSSVNHNGCAIITTTIKFIINSSCEDVIKEIERLKNGTSK